jgi:oligoendopeptidase F
MHSYLSYETQPYADAQYPIFLAEVASTFNEHLMMDYLLKNEKDDLFKLYIIDSYIDGIRGYCLPSGAFCRV